MTGATSCPLCGAEELALAHEWHEPPAGETPFPVPDGRAYHRWFDHCGNCGLYVGSGMGGVDFYSGAYVDATYGDRLAESYERVRALPPDRSDNVQRVKRIVAELGSAGTVLDVGSGIGVFPAAMHEAGWEVTALDPDPRAAEHLRTRVGVETVAADFMSADPLGAFDLVTFNKVLEHVEDPTAMLGKARGCLREGGVVYAEVPDGEGAAAEIAEREEFFIEHLYAFGPESLRLLGERAGFSTRRLERLRDPSGKYTLFAFLD